MAPSCTVRRPGVLGEPFLRFKLQTAICSTRLSSASLSAERGGLLGAQLRFVRIRGVVQEKAWHSACPGTLRVQRHTWSVTHTAFHLFPPPRPPATAIEPGHIPGTVNIPFTEFLTQEGLEKSPEEIRHLFQEKKVDLSQPLVATCGSGVTACHVALGAYICGKPDVPIYDGSWVEWYMRAQPEEVISEGRGKTH